MKCKSAINRIAEPFVEQCKIVQNVKIVIRNAQVAGSSPVTSSIYVRQKRYYARKRLDRATCGHISCSKSEMHFRRYFLRENGLEPPCIKFSYEILCTLHNLPANTENGTRRLFYFRRKLQKRFLVGVNPYHVEKITIYLYSMHKSPVAASVFPNASRRLFLFP